MMFLRRSRFALLACAIGLATCFVGAAGQQAAPAPAATAPLDSKIPVNTQTTVGRLPNGLRYYVRSNGEPRNRAELRLVVNAGSVLEDDDQRGLAHFVEHMAFNGTKHFPKSDVIDFMQSIGMRFGATSTRTRASTRRSTCSQVPTDKPEVLDKAHARPRGLGARRHVRPGRNRQGARRHHRGMAPWPRAPARGCRTSSSRCCCRARAMRIGCRSGIMDVVQNFKHDRLTKFYTDWYRPDLMAVIAVGDFDRATIETLDQDALLRRSPTPITRGRGPSYTVPDASGHALRDRDRQGSDVDERRACTTSGRRPIESTVRAYRQADRRRTVFEHAVERGSRKSRRSRTRRSSAPAPAAAGIVRTNRRGRALGRRQGGRHRPRPRRALHRGRARGAVRIHGDGAGAREGEHHPQFRTRGGREGQAATRRRSPPNSRGTFSPREPIPGIVYESDLYKRFLPEITLAEINALAKTWSPTRPRGPRERARRSRRRGADRIDARRRHVDDAGHRAQALRRQRSTCSRCSQPCRPPDRSSQRRPNDAHGITEWKLSNGAKVVLKPTTFKEDEILIRGFSPGGDVAGERRGLPRGEHGRRDHVGRRPGHVQCRRPQEAARGQGGVCPPVHRTTRTRA